MKSTFPQIELMVALQPEDGEVGFGRWNLTEIATDIGGVLKAREYTNTRDRPPASHRLFSQLAFSTNGDHGIQQLGENDVGNEMDEACLDDVGFGEDVRRGYLKPEVSEAMGGGWLESDDIDEF